MEFGKVGFVEGGKPENPEKNPRSKDENQQQTQLTYDTGTGNRSGPHWWEASALTTAPSLLTNMATNSKKVLENDSYASDDDQAELLLLSLPITKRSERKLTISITTQGAEISYNFLACEQLTVE